MQVPSPLASPILLLTFNRFDVTMRVFEAIKKVAPYRLYLASDGPRNTEEAITVDQIRTMVTSSIDWDCEVKTLFRDTNLGCRNAVNSAITWLFQNEERGIILEDDCLPHPTFFSFCEVLLEKYADNDDIWTISGDNFHRDKGSKEHSYYFSKYFHCWGWATWRRAWKDYQANVEINLSNISKYHLDLVSDDNPYFVTYWMPILEKCQMNQIDTWDYSFLFESFCRKKYHIHPSKNLIENIGFGSDATHTTGQSPNYTVEAMQFPLKHPPSTERDSNADKLTEKIHFKIGIKKKKRKKRYKRLIKSFKDRLALLFCVGSIRNRKKISILKRLKRHVSGKIKLNQITWSYPDPVSFAYAYEQIVFSEIYKFTPVANPRIIDCGANVGIASIYWALQYPNASITSVEADPNIYQYLQKNIQSSGVRNINTINKAVWHEHRTLKFLQDNADGGGISDCLNETLKIKRQEIEVETVLLNSLIDNCKVDLLKIDIEGAECDLLLNQADSLKNVQRLFVEYHSFISKPQRLHELLTLLSSSGFRIHIRPEYAAKQPFVDVKADSGMDNRLNIFAWQQF